MSFRYYITDTFNGRVLGTNDDKVARKLAKCEEYFVIDVEMEVLFSPDSNEAIRNWSDR